MDNAFSLICRGSVGQPGHWFVAAALLLAAIRAVSVAQVQLPFNGWDELPHLAVAYHVHKTGHMPSARTPMPRELIPFITAHPHPTESLTMLCDIDAKPYPGTDPVCSAQPAQRFDMVCYEAQHGPLLYHLAALFLTGSDPATLLAWADGVRLANGVLLVATLWLWHCLLRRVVPRQGRLAWLPDGVLLLLASFSPVYYNFVRFSNDALALFLGTCALAFYMLAVAPHGFSAQGQWRRYALLGGVAGLAVLAKATVLALVLALGAAVVWQGRRPGQRRAALACLFALVLGYLAVAGWHHAVNLARYGQLTAMQEAVLNAGQGFGPAKILGAAGKLGYGFFRNPILYNATLHLAGWSNLRSPDWLNLGFKTAIAGCFLALAAALLRRQARQDAARLAAAAAPLCMLWGATCLALAYHALHSAACWGFPTTGAWYGMLALPVTFGFLLLGPALCGRRAGAYSLLFLAFLANAAFMDGTYNGLLTQETGTTDFYRAIRDVAGHHALLHLDLSLLVMLETAVLAGLLALSLESVLHPAPVVWPVVPPVMAEAADAADAVAAQETDAARERFGPQPVPVCAAHLPVRQLPGPDVEIQPRSCAVAGGCARPGMAARP
ncbi:hypothetical protein GTA51_18120 [Desulfovibrio aerotolerans]|uniref:Uncharacterized protein n=1 Tax=Solidesulfovibrio aerotolerans TaxID=295255 RepID=A0A7C9MHF9_9BACT|nr:glycosyltransferase family 39 protein [Solidesulfovibrio aerotolerans]MYL85030.1 hypothetical protein [Solidesulfovibrio aerotolerans]